MSLIHAATALVFPAATAKDTFMFSGFKPKSALFYALFTSAAQYLEFGAKTLTELANPQADTTSIAERMVEFEHGCDRITHELFRTVNSTFVTPFDRSDIYMLGSTLDDVMDHMEAASHLVSLYGVRELPHHLCDVIDTLDACAQITAEAMPKLASMQGLESYWIKINELENTADHLYRTCLAHLFDGHLDALTVMKLKDIADELEDAADAFEKVSHVIETVVLKES